MENEALSKSLSTSLGRMSELEKLFDLLEPEMASGLAGGGPDGGRWTRLVASSSEWDPRSILK